MTLTAPTSSRMPPRVPLGELDRLSGQVPAAALMALHRLEVGPATVQRLLDWHPDLDLVPLGHSKVLDWGWIERLSHTPALATNEDVHALVTFLTNGHSPEQVQEWAQWGSLDAAWRLSLKSVPLSLVRSLPLSAGDGLSHLLWAVKSITQTAIRVEDLPYWVAASVVVFEPPYLRRDRWALWRSVGVHTLGMPLASLCAAAGLDPREAVTMHAEGRLDVTALRGLAALNMSL